MKVDEATGISADGNVLVGNGRYSEIPGTGSYGRAWYVRLEDPPTEDLIVSDVQLLDRFTVHVYASSTEQKDFEIALFRSADQLFDSSDESVPIDSIHQTDQRFEFQLSNPIELRVDLPYLLAVADPRSSRREINETNNAAATSIEGIDHWEATASIDVQHSLAVS